MPRISKIIIIVGVIIVLIILYNVATRGPMPNETIEISLGTFNNLSKKERKDILSALNLESKDIEVNITRLAYNLSSHSVKKYWIFFETKEKLETLGEILEDDTISILKERNGKFEYKYETDSQRLSDVNFIGICKKHIKLFNTKRFFEQEEMQNMYEM